MAKSRNRRRKPQVAPPPALKPKSAPRAPTPVSSEHNQWHLARLFSRWKLPGWAFILFALFEELPDWHHRVSFWIDILHNANSELTMFADVISSSYFSPSLAVIGVLWLIFVGEPKKAYSEFHGYQQSGGSLLAFV
jgi:hypothetical protein